jgi:hypothetical protein
LAFRLVITIKQRVCLSFHSLQKRFPCWVKLPTTSLLRGTLVDLTRGKSELLAENALLRHQLTILRRQIKRPVYRKSDRLLLVLLASMVRTWKQALFLVQEDDASALAPWTLPFDVEAQINGALEEAEALARDHQLDQGDGGKQPTLGSGAHPWRTPQAGDSGE